MILQIIMNCIGARFLYLYSLQPIIINSQRETWPKNYLPAGNVPVVGFEPTYREDQYELFVKADRFYGPVPLHWQITTLFVAVRECFLSTHWETLHTKCI